MSAIQTPSLLRRSVIFVYGVASYALFFATFCYAAGFIGNFLVPKSIDAPATAPFGTAFAINAALLGLFAVQHSVMARPAFKRWWTSLIPEAAERSTYTLLSSLALLLLFAFWQPMGGMVWDMRGSVAGILMNVGFAFGFLLVLVTTFLINHFDLFGLRQVWKYLRNQPYTALKFVTPGPYRLVRHPLYVGWLFSFWCTPTMTVAHLVFAVATTAYILIAIRLEERDLVDHHGRDYVEYRKRTPMLVPGLGTSDDSAATRRNAA